MSLLEEKAAEVAGYMRDSEDSPVSDVVAFDPITILMIISILLSCIQIWQRCGATPVIAAENIKDSALSRGQIRRLIRAESRKISGRAEQKEFRASMTDAVHKMASKLTVQDMEKLFADAETRAY
eukprot:gnl/Spiro4/12900_TR6833_c0_g1_i1.p2 gnl/Spiro4/12900_TR6833_c0_g1~~gnl/Spiro4/12900_TR6833_c0_g1_i1.p2  ORF type:complete len:125 (-),score=17.15 gnl/Spiro4/12900_TR6833_c0_g1_i1:689-1063(-)